MDPDGCFRALLDALASQHWERALEHASVLAAWLERGGLPPVS